MCLPSLIRGKKERREVEKALTERHLSKRGENNFYARHELKLFS